MLQPICYIIKYRVRVIILCILLFGATGTVLAQHTKITTIYPAAWAKNSVNAVVFRKNALTTFHHLEYAAFYDSAGFVMLAVRTIGNSHWAVRRTPYKGDVTDAHKSISIMADGKGFIHVAWGQHNNPLNYAKSISAGSLLLGPRVPMLGQQEDHLTYPEFYRLPNGNLLFLYRDGGSGNGNLVMNKYNISTEKWTRLQNNLIDGEGRRSAYWQMTVDPNGGLHISWVWRETPDVATNHDMAYACSKDGGITWQRSTGQTYRLPIVASTAEYARRIPQNSNLINQTSMVTDQQGRPYIATYYQDKGASDPQYHIIYKDASGWQVDTLKLVNHHFDLSGMGTKAIPISRPQLLVWSHHHKTAAALIFRDDDNGGQARAATTSNLQGHHWRLRTLFSRPVGSWEPSYNTELWNTRGVLDLFIQRVRQADAEGQSGLAPQPVQVLEWKIKSDQ